jgi:hypothetical protein
MATSLPVLSQALIVSTVTVVTATGQPDVPPRFQQREELEASGGLLGVREFPVTAAGYSLLLGWLGGFGTVCLAGIEGTGSYGAGLARYLSTAGVRVVEVNRSDRQDRRRQGKSDPLDAVSAARAAHSGRARGAPPLTWSPTWRPCGPGPARYRVAEGRSTPGNSGSRKAVAKADTSIGCFRFAPRLAPREGAFKRDFLRPRPALRHVSELGGLPCKKPGHRGDMRLPACKRSKIITMIEIFH